MSTKKISELSTLAAPASGDVLAIVSGGTTYKIAASDLDTTYAIGDGGLTTKDYSQDDFDKVALLSVTSAIDLDYITVTTAIDLDAIASSVSTNNGKATNVTTDLSTSSDTTSVTIVSSDGDDATVSTASATDAGVMSVAQHDKLAGLAVTSTSVTDGTTTFDKYTHPTGNGARHLPQDGFVGQVLTNTSTGQGTWQTSTAATTGKAIAMAMVFG